MDFAHRFSRQVAVERTQASLWPPKSRVPQVPPPRHVVAFAVRQPDDLPRLDAVRPGTQPGNSCGSPQASDRIRQDSEAGDNRAAKFNARARHALDGLLQ
jgi:hypothetical protein